MWFGTVGGFLKGYLECRTGPKPAATGRGRAAQQILRAQLVPGAALNTVSYIYSRVDFAILVDVNSKGHKIDFGEFTAEVIRSVAQSLQGESHPITGRN